MKTTIDSAGRVVIPKALRVEAGLEPGREVEVRVRGGVVEIEPAALEVRLEPAGPFVVATPLGAIATLTEAEVEETRGARSQEGLVAAAVGGPAAVEVEQGDAVLQGVEQEPTHGAELRSTSPG